MRAPTILRDRTVGFNMTPMIDIVFLLIIFFLLSSHLARQETLASVELPSAASGRVPRALAQRRLLVNVLADGQLLVGTESVNPATLAQRVDHERRRGKGALEVAIRADRRAPYSHVRPVLSACATAGVWKVTFAVHAGRSGSSGER